MTIAYWDRVQELFEQVAAAPNEQRRRLLTDLCPDDAALRDEVLSLLEHDQRAQPEFLAPLEPPGAGSDSVEQSLVGTRVGKYQIKRLIAGGGMGRVYEAEQDNPRRIVALKVVPTWAWSPTGRRRFEFEIEALARLTHPNIAQIYDADVIRGLGAADGTPYFVLEFVPDARSIVDYAEQCGLEIGQKLELVVQLCDAVHYGHQRGIIHRDLKPANILVDARGRVKVIDFGIAKATDSDLAATAAHTHEGQLVGTLNYMSPEQCAGDPRELDVRTDVYSLGVVLYQLLCGRLPYGRGIEALRHKGIKGQSRGRKPTDKGTPDKGDPASPVTGLAPGALIPTPSAYQIIKSICDDPPIRPRELNREIRGNLEFILLKSLEKNPDKRYQSAADLARDIRHVLAREPIDARRPTLAASVSRWIARHPIATTALAAVTVGVTVLATVTVTVYLAHLRPYQIELRNDNREAALLSLNGNVLHNWTSFARNGLQPALIVALPERGPSRLLLLGFHSTQPEPLQGRLSHSTLMPGIMKSQSGAAELNLGMFPQQSLSESSLRKTSLRKASLDLSTYSRSRPDRNSSRLLSTPIHGLRFV